MVSQLTQFTQLCRKAVWEVDLSQVSSIRAAYVRLLRVLHTVARELGDGQLNLRAMSLVYTTLLALVPLLAVSFSVLKAFGVHNQLEDVLLNMLSPLGQEGIELTYTIIRFVDNVKVGVLGSFGLALLFYTVVSMIQKIEGAFNHAWRIKQTRGVAERFSDYLSVLIIGPVFVFTALGLTATITTSSVYQRVADIELLGFAFQTTSKLVPYLLVIGAFTFTYKFIPNTRVTLRAAFTGGVVAGVLWETAGWAFASVVVNSTQYTAIYSSFAILVLFMLWLYLSWLILLVGSSVAFYSQNPQYVGMKSADFNFSGRLRERIALQCVYLIARSYYLDRPGWTGQSLAVRLDVPSEPLIDICQALEEANILTTSANNGQYLPMRDLGTVALRDVLRAVRSAADTSEFHESRLLSAPAVEALINRLDEAWASALGDLSVAEFALDEQERDAVDDTH